MGRRSRTSAGSSSVFLSFAVIAGSSEVVFAFRWCEGVDALGDGVPEVIDGSGGGLFEESLELGEGHFNGVKVRAVGRQEAQLCRVRWPCARRWVCGRVSYPSPRYRRV